MKVLNLCESQNVSGGSVYQVEDGIYIWNRMPNPNWSSDNTDEAAIVEELRANGAIIMEVW